MTSTSRRNFIKLASAASTGVVLSGTEGAMAKIQETENSISMTTNIGNPFDVVHNRRGTNSIKWDFFYQDGIPHEVDHKAQVVHEADNRLETTPLPMSLSDMEFQTSPKIIEALEKRVKHGIFGYTKPTKSYYQSISNWMSNHYGWQIEENWVIKTAGVMPAVNMAIQAYTEPGDKIIIQTPVFHPFGQSIENNNRIVLRNSLLLENKKYVMDFDDLEQKASDPKTKMIIFCSPHNPVGRVWTRAELTRLGEICLKHEVLIVSDEIHCDLIYSWAEFTSFAIIDDRLNEQLIVCNSPSKSFNLPGLKTASTIISNPELREKFNKILLDLNELFSVNTLGTLALETAYEQGEPWLEQLKEYLEGNYLYLKDYINNSIPGLRLQEAEGLYLVWVDCSGLGLNDEELRSLFINEAKVYPEQGSTYGLEGEGFVRLNIACPRSMLKEALMRIENAVASI